MVIRLLPQKNKIEKKIRAIILCAGEGTRIRDYTEAVPKPLIKIDSLTKKPILYHLINNLVKLEIESIVIVSGHLSSKIEEYVSFLKKNDDDLRNALSIVHSGTRYKRGPLYSFLSITKDKTVFEKEFLYFILPGDTYFEFDLLSKVLEMMNSNLKLIRNHPILIYKKIRGKTLKVSNMSQNLNKLISTVSIAKKHSKEIVKEIIQQEISSFKDDEWIRQMIPIFIFTYDFINEITRKKLKDSVKTIREIINLIIKGRRILYALPIKPKYEFYDIDTKFDLLRLIQKKKKDNRRSD